MSSLTTLTKTGAVAKNITSTASGAIVAGKPVIINSNGTVTQTAETLFTSNAIGTPDDAGTSYRAGNESGACYHTGINRTILSFPNSGNSYYATCTTATISGTTMTMGAPTVINSTACASVKCAYDATENVVVFYYKYNGNGNAGRVRAATVSGNSFSFGSESNVFGNTSISGGHDICNVNDGAVAICTGSSAASAQATVQIITMSGTTLTVGGATGYMSSTTASVTRIASGKKGELLCQMGHSSHMRYTAATVSGTVVSAGATIELSGGSNSNNLASGYWAGYTIPESHYIAAYQNPGGSEGDIVARLITVSGTTLTLNAVTSLTADCNNSNQPGMGWGSSAQQALYYYRSNSTSSKGYVVELSYSGTTVSEANNTEIGTSKYMNWGVTWDPDAKKSIVMYQDGSNSDTAEVNCYTPTSSTTNLTPANFMGISEGGASNGGEASVIAQGGTVTGLSGLTIGSDYYSGKDGTLGTSNVAPHVKVGKAISTTSLILTGDS
jgi:hypothetical protein